MTESSTIAVGQRSGQQGQQLGRRGRIAWIDYAKAFAIIGVFLLHSAAPAFLLSVIGSSAMMLFFLLSGLVFSIRRHPRFLPFVWHRVRTLLIPGLFLAVVPFLIERVIAFCLRGERWAFMEYARYLLGYVINLRGREGFGSIFWFLVCLFVIEIAGFVLAKLATKTRKPDVLIGAAALAALVVGYLYSRFVHIVLPWCADVAVPMFAFFALGMLLRRHMEKLARAIRAYAIVPAFIVLVAATWCNLRISGTAPNPYMNSYGEFVCFVVGAVAGIWGTLAASRMIADCCADGMPVARCLARPLNWLGRNTLVLYCVNGAIYPAAIPAMLRAVGLNPDSTALCMQCACGLGAIIINLLICCPVAAIMNRWLPAVLGKRPLLCKSRPSTMGIRRHKPLR